MLTAWVLNPQSGPAGIIKGMLPSTQAMLSGIAIVLALVCVGLL